MAPAGRAGSYPGQRHSRPAQPGPPRPWPGAAILRRGSDLFILIVTHFYFLAPLAGVEGPSAALLYRNWLIRFSRTTADCVVPILSPGARFFSSAPASIPMYCSPSRPAVRIFSELSLGKA